MKLTGRRRKRWFFFTQYEYSGPVYKGYRWQNPKNVDKWPVETWWSY